MSKGSRPIGLYVLGAVLLTVVLGPILFVVNLSLGFPLFNGFHHKDVFEWNQRLTLKVQTPEGPVSGSGIVRVWVSIMDPCPYSGMSQLCVEKDKSGEATVVVLPNGKYLFALIPQQPEYMAQDAFREVLPSPDGQRLKAQAILAAMQEVSRPVAVPAKRYPKLVYFEDINDPTSVKEADPDHLAGVFGSGYSLSSITLEMTDEAPVFGTVESALPENFFQRTAEIHHLALDRAGIYDPYFKTLLSELKRGLFIIED